MAQLDWYNENANRSYPFINNTVIDNKCILDCGFYIYNEKDKKVWLQGIELTDNDTTYTFTYTDCPEPLSFTAPINNKEWQTIWNDNDYWKGFVVIGQR